MDILGLDIKVINCHIKVKKTISIPINYCCENLYHRPTTSSYVIR